MPGIFALQKRGSVNKPYSEACEQNRQPILEVIKPLFRDRKNILEIGSGTGQHAVYFAAEMPHLNWQPTDTAEYLHGIQLWLDDAKLNNARSPLTLDVMQSDWPVCKADAVFSANTTHIMNWPMVKAFFSGVGEYLPADGLFVLYGPFNYDNQYTSPSNARFDALLKAHDPESGIRNFEDLNGLAEKAGMKLQQDSAMPANNRILCWVQR